MNDRHPLLIVAKELGYPKIDRLNAWTSQNIVRANGIIEASVKTERAILFFQGAMFEVSPFGSVHHFFGISSREKAPNYLLFGPELNEKYLRHLFTGIELIIFKLYHIACKNNDPDIHFEQQKTKQTLNRLREIIDQSDWENYVNLFDELFFVRNAFAHSFIDLEKIRYRGVALKRCFGETYLGRYYGPEIGGSCPIFFEDVCSFVNPLIDAFRRFQLKQIDDRKLFRLCNNELKTRNLAP